MIAGNHSEDVISETLGLLGLKDGGVVKMKDGGIMDLGGKEMDLRGGGFVPIGKKERLASLKDGGIMDLGGKEKWI